MTKTRHGAKRPLVLVVDDDPDLRMLADMQLSQGFDVIQASSGQECVALASEQNPDVILLDMMMPGMDGSAVLNKLSSDPNTADIPVIFLSALSDTQDKVGALEAGAVDWISKSVDPRELVARVGAAARTKARQEEIRLGGDPITRLPDRKVFTSRLTQEIARSSRSNAAVSILLIDIDHLDELNEKHGREVGDELLSHLAETLRHTLRESDELFRYGGDEFAVLLPDAEVGTAFLAAERCREDMAKVEVAGAPSSVSIGVAQYSSGRTAEEVIARAEIALFRAKESGGGRSWRADDPRRQGLNPVSLAEQLTEREWDILVHLSHRRTEHEIARRLGITRGTVRSHKARIRRKLEVSREVRLSDFVRANFKDLVSRLPDQQEPRSL